MVVAPAPDSAPWVVWTTLNPDCSRGNRNEDSARSDPKQELPRKGVIALLEDTNGDGRYDKRTNFVEGQTYPNGIMVWNGGVFVSCAPDLLYLKDTNGDGRADIQKVVLTGFSTDRTAATRFSHPTLGMDNWVYLTSGLNGGTVTAPAHAKRPPVEFARSDSRFNPFTFEFELTGGQGSTASPSTILAAVSSARTVILSGTS